MRIRIHTHTHTHTHTHPLHTHTHTPPYTHRRASPGPHHVMIQTKGQPPQPHPQQPHPQQPHPQQLQTPATPVASIQSTYAAVPSYSHPIGPSGSGISGVPGGGYMTTGVPATSQMFGGPGSTSVYGQPRMQPSQGVCMDIRGSRTNHVAISQDNIG